MSHNYASLINYYTFNNNDNYTFIKLNIKTNFE